jgi:betaine-aldehyde dehydrogenase
VAALRDWILDNQARLDEQLQRETGRAWGEVAADRVELVGACSYYLDNAARFLAESRPRPHSPMTMTKALTVIQRPYPLVGVIGPWNYPLGLALLDAIPALIAGCAVLVKPSEMTPLTVAEVARAWVDEIGAPPVFRAVNGGPQTGVALVDACDFVQFTGSARTGREVMRQAAERLTPVSLELGGKDPMIVLADADLERAANGAVWGAMFNSGQTCVSVERVYVEVAVHDDFVERVHAKVRELRQGPDDRGHRADVGAMATARQVAIVERHVADAVEKGARVLAGGTRPREGGNWFAPTVLVGVNHEMLCMREETFGPTLPIMSVADADEAVRLANDSEYGLSASIWSRDRDRAVALARRLECGAVNINDIAANLVNFPAPMAGWKSSGLGSRLGGEAGIRKFCRPEAILDTRIAQRSEPNWYPYSRAKTTLIDRAARLFTARGRRRLFRRGR